MSTPHDLLQPPAGPPAPGVVIAADEVPLPAWLVERVNEAGEHIARKRR